MQKLCVGVDIGKEAHHICFYLFEKKKNPVFSIANEREAFETLAIRMKEHAPLDQCSVLLESTGHYGANLIQFLIEHGVTIYRISPKARYGANASKNDANDARTLALLLYQQLIQEVFPLEKSWHIRKLIPASEVARELRGMVQLRKELSRELARRTNKLIAIQDELFPERRQILANPCSDAALALLAVFPSPRSIAGATIDELCKARPRGYPNRSKLERLQDLARATIGTKDAARQRCLLTEQKILISQYQQHQDDIDILDKEIERILLDSREGMILASFTGIAATFAATIIASIGTIGNFSKPSELRAFLGWNPKSCQTGTSYDIEKLDRKRNRPLRSMMYLVVASAIQHDPYWKALYERLVPLKCAWDGRKKEYMGKMKVIGIIAGHLIKIIYVLLKRDYDLVQAMQGKEGPLPAPELYSVEKVGKKHEITPALKSEDDA